MGDTGFKGCLPTGNVNFCNQNFKLLEYLDHVLQQLQIDLFFLFKVCVKLCQSDPSYNFSNTYTVYDCIEAQAFISYKSFLTRRLNETGVNLDPGVYFLLATC